jgi:hypothetical protein
MNNVNLIEYLNKEVVDLDGDKTLFGEIELSFSMEYKNKSKGIAICCHSYNLPTIRYITIYNNYNDFNKYEGNLPEEIEFNYSLEKAREILLLKGWQRNSSEVIHDGNNLYSEIFIKGKTITRITDKLSNDRNSNEIVGITLGNFEDIKIF